MRTFIAAHITPTPELKQALDDLREIGGPVKPVADENLHITLRFIGEIDEALVPSVNEVLLRSVANQRPFEVLLSGLGVFPHAARPAIVWVGVRFAEPLTEIAAELEKGLVPLGIPAEERPFRPHLTLARVRARPPRELGTYLQQHEKTKYGTASIAELHLFRSELRPEGAKYTPLHTAALKAE